MLRHRDASAARQSHVALAGQQALHREVHRDERGRTGGLHRQAGTGQVQLVGDTRGEEIGVVAEHRLVVADRRQQLGVAAEVVKQVGVGPRAGIDADQPRIAAGVVAGVLQRLPRAFEQQPVLRVEDLCFAGIEAEEAGIEALGAGDERPRRNVGRVVHQPRFDARRAQLVGGEEAYRLAAGGEVVPEALQVVGAGEAPRHADHRDGGLVSHGASCAP